jgi:hypothetical protein
MKEPETSSEVLFPVLFVVDMDGSIKDVKYSTLNLKYQACPTNLINYRPKQIIFNDGTVMFLITGLPIVQAKFEKVCPEMIRELEDIVIIHIQQYKTLRL